MSKQHLDAFALTARLLEGLGLGERSRHVAGLLMNAARALARRLLRTASLLEDARSAIACAGSVEEQVIVHDLAGRGENVERRADVDVALLVEGEVLAREGAVFALGFVDDGDVRCDPLFVDKPIEVRRRAVGRIGSEPLGLDAEAFSALAIGM